MSQFSGMFSHGSALVSELRLTASPEEDTIRVLIATDNHVGYEERDSIRKDDSWQTFDEIMTLARTQDVDMVLLAGDLFHENKPSRKSMFKVMRSLRKNCLGMKPCELQFLSDASEVFDGHFTHVNYEDPDINISIPVFSIHGNHDDPSGEGAFCPLDILQVAGLVNYFGRVPEADNPQARPILLQKGQTKLALYGLSNVRDERMYRNFRDHRVKWFRPDVQKSDWFNLLAVHQNHTAHTPTSYLPEGMLPDWLDMVVWGHEHECLLDPQRNPQTGFHVIQPGSSVATSLVPSEAVPKHVAVLSVSGRDFQIEKHRLKTVRPFVTREIKLSDDERFEGLDHKKDNRTELTRRLMAVVEEMIKEAQDEWLEIQEDAEDANERIPLPLIRLKVEYTPSEGGHFDVENPQRLSNRFAGKVANTNDVVHFYRKKKSATRQITAVDIPGLPGNVDQETIKVDELVGQFLEHQSLKILPQAPFIDAVNQYVKHDDKRAMDEFVRDTLTGQVKQMLTLGNNDEDEIHSVMAEYQAKLDQQFKQGLLKRRKAADIKPKPADWDSDMDGHWEDQPGVVTYEDDAVAKSQPVKGARGRPKKTTQIVEEDEDEDEDMGHFREEEEEEAAPKPKGRGKVAATKSAAPAKAPSKKPPAKAPAKGRGRKPVFEEDSEDDDAIMDDEPPAPPPKRATAATRTQPARSQPSRGAASQSQAKMKQATLNFSQKPKASQAAVEISDDEISDDEDPFESMPAKKVTRKR
ncbi:putative Metallo-dependent phosphatase-like protein [Seiridium unicorne]|uniref:Double-strand break repair protein n=1 Tax=Seiridium unicorne TaxID=138068 RepID=A0ABR2UG58_9PEZI